MKALRVLGYIWSAPLTLLGVLLAFLYIPTSVRWSDGCLEIRPLWILGGPGAQTHGWLIFYRDQEAQNDLDLRVHERVHVTQAFHWGVFYGLVWVLHWGWNATVVRPKDPSRYPEYLPFHRDGKLAPWWWRAYVIVCWELQAYRIQDEYRHGLRPGAWGSALA